MQWRERDGAESLTGRAPHIGASVHASKPAIKSRFNEAEVDDVDGRGFSCTRGTAMLRAHATLSVRRAGSSSGRHNWAGSTAKYA
jgi:hypothetical protein